MRLRLRRAPAMEPSPLPALLPLLLLPPLAPLAPAPAAAPGSAPAACGAFPGDPMAGPGSQPSWTWAYIPMRNCHRVLRDKQGEFSPPVYRGNSPINFWCNWTIWAGSRQHIIIYIQGFTTKEDCNKNEDKILFEGMSSLAEDSVVFACWRKETHVFATFAEAVHVVLLKTYVPRCRDTRFKGRYYIFQHEEAGLSSGEDAVAEAPAPTLPKRDHVPQPGQAKGLGGALSFASAVIPGGLDGPEVPASPRGPELLDQGAPCGPGAPGRCGRAQGTGDAPGAGPTAAPGPRALSRPVSGDIAEGFGHTRGFSSLLSATPALGALQGEEPFLRAAGTGLESRQDFLQATSLGDPWWNVKPTHTSDMDLAVPSPDSSPGREGSEEEGIDPAMCPGLSTVGLEKTECPLLSRAAGGAMGGLAESLMPSLTIQNDVVGEDCSLLLPARSFPEPLSMAEPVLTTSVLQYTTFPSFPDPGSLGEVAKVEKLLHPMGSRDVPQGQPQLSARSCCALQVAPTGYLPHVSVAPGHAPSGASPSLGMEVTLVPARPEAAPASTELGSARSSLAASLPAEGPVEPLTIFSTNTEGFSVPPAQELGALAKGTEPPAPSAPCGSAGACASVACCPPQGGDFAGPLVDPGVRRLVLDGDAGSGWRAEAAAPAASAGGESFPAARDLQQQLPDPQLGTGHPPPEDLVAPSVPPVPVSLPPTPVPQDLQIPGGDQHHKHAELGPPWAMEYFPARSCHVVLQGEFGLFYPPLHSDTKTNVWCNWTIWAGPQKHILIYIQGFQTSEGCDKNQDKMIFQGVLSSVETKVVHACYNRGTVIFATQATAVYVLLLSGSKYEHFKGQYYIFRDYAVLGSSGEMPAPVWEISKLDISSKVTQPHDLKEGANGGEFRLLEDETELERSLGDGKTEGRGDGKEVLVEPAAAREGAGQNTEFPGLDVVEGGARLEPAWDPTAPCSTTEVPLEAPGSSARPSAAPILPDLAQTRRHPWVGVATVTRPSPTQMVVMEELPLGTNVEPSPLYPSLGTTAGGTAMPGDSQEDLLDLASVLASLENDTVLPSQHHPGDVLFEVTVEIKHTDWVPRGGRELHKDLLESMRSHIQKNLKLSANRVNEVKLKEIRRAGRENLLLSFWLHLRPEERNLSLALRSQLQELLREPAGAERPRLVSLLVEDVNECGLGLCGEAADCFNGVGTYLCRCKEGYEDRSPTKSGTLCVPAPRSGFSSFFQQPEVLLGAATSLGLALLVVAALVLRRTTRRRRSMRNPFLEEPGARREEEPVAEVVMELSHLEDCLALEPFQLKVRARPPEWISRAHAGRASRAFVQQEESL